MVLHPHRRIAGTTLIETTIAAAVSALFLGSLFSINTAAMQTVKMARETASASEVLQQRIEALRIANWHQVTDATWLKNNLLNTAASGTAALKNVAEQLTLVPYGSATAGNTQLVRSTSGVVTVVNNQPLLTENAVEVIWTLTYSGTPNDRPMTRQVVTILAKGGVAKW